MIQDAQLKPRDLYLDRLIAFQDTEPIKIVTGIRRCGKSKLLDLMISHLLRSGIEEKQIIKMNFESYSFTGFTMDDFHKYVSERIIPGKRMYLFFDEPHKVKEWETVVNSFRVDLDCDIYITGSNAHMLSSDYSTYLSGRYVEIKMFPLSFSEFLYFHGFQIVEQQSVLGGLEKRFQGSDGAYYDRKDIFAAYLRYGGMPGIAEIGLDQERVNIYLDGVYNTVVTNDIWERDKWSNQKRITNPVLLKKIALFLADNIGNETSYSGIRKTVKDDNRSPSDHTVQDYVSAYMDAFFYYETKRYDIKGKELLKTNGKFYIVDLGFRNALLGYKNIDRGHALENVVFLELLRRGYDVSIGKVGTREVDFRAVDTNETIYYQVTEQMDSPDTRNREYAPFLSIDDNYEKIILSTETETTNINGIKTINIIDWLLKNV